jgi:hypothetical protein
MPDCGAIEQRLAGLRGERGRLAEGMSLFQGNQQNSRSRTRLRSCAPS